MDQDPYRVTPPLPGRPEDSWVIDIPGSITRPITYMWVMLAVLSALSVVSAMLVLLLANQHQGIPIAAVAGLTTCTYVLLAIGIYKRIRWVAVGTLTISVIGLLSACVTAAMGAVSAPALVMSGVMTFVSVRGTIAIYAFHRLAADARRRPPGQPLSRDPALAGETDA